MANLWKGDEEVRKWILKQPCPTFRDKYDTVKQQITEISCTDDLLSGETLNTMYTLCMSIHCTYRGLYTDDHSKNKIPYRVIKVVRWTLYIYCI